MKDLFLKRKQAFRKECVGYLRYVLNDHFVLFLLVLIGFLAYQYSQLLQDFPENHWPILLFLGIGRIPRQGRGALSSCRQRLLHDSGR